MLLGDWLLAADDPRIRELLQRFPSTVEDVLGAGFVLVGGMRTRAEFELSPAPPSGSVAHDWWCAERDLSIGEAVSAYFAEPSGRRLVVVSATGRSPEVGVVTAYPDPIVVESIQLDRLIRPMMGMSLPSKAEIGLYRQSQDDGGVAGLLDAHERLLSEAAGRARRPHLQLRTAEDGRLVRCLASRLTMREGFAVGFAQSGFWEDLAEREAEVVAWEAETGWRRWLRTPFRARAWREVEEMRAFGDRMRAITEESLELDALQALPLQQVPWEGAAGRWVVPEELR